MSSNVDNRFSIESIFGTWYLHYSDKKMSSWFLQRDSGNDRGWGRTLVFNESGEFVDTISDQCTTGLHSWLGRWKWNEDEQTLFIQIEEAGVCYYIEPSEYYKKGVVLYVKQDAKDKVFLVPLNPDTELEKSIV